MMPSDSRAASRRACRWAASASWPARASSAVARRASRLRRRNTGWAARILRPGIDQQRDHPVPGHARPAGWQSARACSAARPGSGTDAAAAVRARAMPSPVTATGPAANCRRYRPVARGLGRRFRAATAASPRAPGTSIAVVPSARRRCVLIGGLPRRAARQRGERRIEDDIVGLKRIRPPACRGQGFGFSLEGWSTPSERRQRPHARAQHAISRRNRSGILAAADKAWHSARPRSACCAAAAFRMLAPEPLSEPGDIALLQVRRGIRDLHPPAFGRAQGFFAPTRASAGRTEGVAQQVDSMRSSIPASPTAQAPGKSWSTQARRRGGPRSGFVRAAAPKGRTIRGRRSWPDSMRANDSSVSILRYARRRRWPRGAPRASGSGGRGQRRLRALARSRSPAIVQSCATSREKRRSRWIASRRPTRPAMTGTKGASSRGMSEAGAGGIGDRGVRPRLSGAVEEMNAARTCHRLSATTMASARAMPTASIEARCAPPRPSVRVRCRPPASSARAAPSWAARASRRPACPSGRRASK